MKKSILRYLYKRYQRDFEDLLVESFVQNVPEKTTYDGFDVIREHKAKFQRLTNYFAYELHRRMANDSRNSERYQGMFIQLKMLNQVIGSRPDLVDPLKNEQVSEPIQNKYEDFIEAATTFAEKFKK